MNLTPSPQDWTKTAWLIILMAGWGYVSQSLIEYIGIAVIILPIPLLVIGHHFLWGKPSKWRPAWFPGWASWKIPLSYYSAIVVPLIIILAFWVLIGVLLVGVVWVLGQTGLVNEDGAGVIGKVMGRAARKIFVERNDPIDLLLFLSWVFLAAQTFHLQRVIGIKLGKLLKNKAPDREPKN